MSCSAALAQPQTKTRLAKGKVAPFAGVLLSDAALSSIISQYEKKLSTAKLELERLSRIRESESKTATAISTAKLESAKAQQAACLRDLGRRDALLTKALDKCSKPAPWYKAPQLHFVLGSVISGGVCAAAMRLR